MPTINTEISSTQIDIDSVIVGESKAIPIKRAERRVAVVKNSFEVLYILVRLL